MNLIEADLIRGLKETIKHKDKMLINQIEEIEKLNKIIYKLDGCIKDFLCTKEYMTGDMEAISNNYVKLLNIVDELKEGK